MRAVLNEDFFSILDPTTSWPQLRTLRIDLDPCTPASDWMLEIDPTDTDIEDFDTDEEETYEYAIEEGLYRHETEYPARMHLPRRSFRTAVNPDILNDMYLAVARAKMPNLRDLKLNVETQFQESGCLCTFTSDGRSSHKVVWQSRSATMYEPHEDVIAAWEQVFAERTGELEIQVL